MTDNFMKLVTIIPLQYRGKYGYFDYVIQIFSYIIIEY